MQRFFTGDSYEHIAKLQAAANRKAAEADQTAAYDPHTHYKDEAGNMHERRVPRYEDQTGAITAVLGMPSLDPLRLPDDSEARKAIPMATGLLDYFPDALAEVSRLSKVGNDKHNPGQPLHWSRGKSNDHADTIMRHMVDRGKMDTDGFLHDVKVAWRALAQLQLALEAHRK